jgi:hypothetical protein
MSSKSHSCAPGMVLVSLMAISLKEELMGGRCRCGTEVKFTFNHLGCIECGAACCPACSYQLESTNYCSACAETLLELPWARTLQAPARA